MSSILGPRLDQVITHCKFCMNPFDISLELSRLSLFQQPSFRTTILRQVVPDNNFEKMQIIAVDNSFATSRYRQTFYKSCKSLSWTFFATKSVLIRFFPSFDLLLHLRVSSEIIVQDIISSQVFNL